MSRKNYSTKAKPTDQDRQLSIGEVITITGRSRTSVLNDVKAGRLPQPHKFGGRNYWWLSDLMNCLK